MQSDSSFVWLTIEEIAAPWSGAIKIGPFGSQLKKEELSPEGYKVYGQENVISGDFSAGDRYVDNSKFSQLQSCQLFPGDVVISMMGTIGHCEVFPENAEIGIMDSHLLRIQPNTEVIIPEFLVKAIKSESIVRRQITQMSHGSIMSGLSSKIVKRLTIPVPPLPEQRHIAEILDAADEAIRQTERVIANLRQVKAGLLHDLLTRGLDAEGRLRDPAAYPEQFKDSPLGRIPKGWELKPLADFADVDRGKFTHRPRNDPAFYGGKYPFIQTGDITSAEGGILSSYSQTLNERGTSVSREFPAGTIAITIAANIADTAVLGAPMYFPDSVVGAVVQPPYNVRYIELCIRRAKTRLEAQAPQSAQKNINLETLRPLLIPAPSPEEQERIAGVYIAADARIRAEETTLAKLRQVKRGLMDDLLTGRVRV